jgi:hypothetical protein
MERPKLRVLDSIIICILLHRLNRLQLFRCIGGTVSRARYGGTNLRHFLHTIKPGQLVIELVDEVDLIVDVLRGLLFERFHGILIGVVVHLLNRIEDRVLVVFVCVPERLLHLTRTNLIERHSFVRFVH